MSVLVARGDVLITVEQPNGVGPRTFRLEVPSAETGSVVLSFVQVEDVIAALSKAVATVEGVPCCFNCATTRMGGRRCLGLPTGARCPVRRPE